MEGTAVENKTFFLGVVTFILKSEGLKCLSHTLGSFRVRISLSSWRAFIHNFFLFGFAGILKDDPPVGPQFVNTHVTLAGGGTEEPEFIRIFLEFVYLRNVPITLWNLKPHFTWNQSKILNVFNLNSSYLQVLKRLKMFFSFLGVKSKQEELQGHKVAPNQLIITIITLCTLFNSFMFNVNKVSNIIYI